MLRRRARNVRADAGYRQRPSIQTQPPWRRSQCPGTHAFRAAGAFRQRPLTHT